MNNPVRFSDTDIKKLLEKLERAARMRPPKKVVGLTLSNNVLHIRFAYPMTRETEAEPLPLRTPAILFRDEETGEVTALEVVDVEEALKELKESST